MLKFILCGFILGILLKMLSNALNNLSNDMEKAIRKKSEENKYNRKIEEEKCIKEKWINDLRNGKTVNIGFQTIQCKNDIFIIGEERFSVKEIQRLDFIYDIIGVTEHEQRLVNDYSVSSGIGGCHFEHVKEVSMTYEEFNKKVLEDIKHPKPKYSGFPSYSVYHEFINAYYILIKLNSGKEEQCLLGYSEDRFGKTLNDYSVQEYMVLELGKYINELKVKASTIYL